VITASVEDCSAQTLTGLDTCSVERKHSSSYKCVARSLTDEMDDERKYTTHKLLQEQSFSSKIRFSDKNLSPLKEK